MSKKLKIKIGSRKSRLATIQSEWVKEQLLKTSLKADSFNSYEIDCEIVFFDTKGDQILDKALHKVGDKGLFTAELENSLLNGEIDIAVHSLKDMPTEENDELPVVVITKREEPWDCVVFNEKFSGCKSIIDLPQNSVIGTSSLRRVAQLKHKRPDFEFYPLRGNVETRIRKIREEIKTGENNLAAGVLALAGLKRLGLEKQAGEVLGVDLCIPAPGQGALAIQASKHCFGELQQLLQTLNHEETSLLVRAERAALRAIDGGCQTPFGAYAEFINEQEVQLTAVLGSKDLSKIAFEKVTRQQNEFRRLGQETASRLLVGLE